MCLAAAGVAVNVAAWTTTAKQVRLLRPATRGLPVVAVRVVVGAVISAQAGRCERQGYITSVALQPTDRCITTTTTTSTRVLGDHKYYNYSLCRGVKPALLPHHLAGRGLSHCTVAMDRRKAEDGKSRGKQRWRKHAAQSSYKLGA